MMIVKVVWISSVAKGNQSYQTYAYDLALYQIFACALLEKSKEMVVDVGCYSSNLM